MTEAQSWTTLRNHVLMCPQCYRVNHSPATVADHGCPVGARLATDYRDATTAVGRPEQFTRTHRPSRFDLPRPWAWR